jgi:hypothetical protein
MSSDWLDNVARRIARGRAARNPPPTEADARELATTLQELSRDERAGTISSLSRRASLKWGIGAATAAITAQASTGLADADLTGHDDDIITAIDGLLEDNDLFGEIGAALVFYEAADVLGSGEPPSSVQCEPDQIFCSCYGGFCLVAGDCSSYCS